MGCKKAEDSFQTRLESYIMLRAEIERQKERLARLETRLFGSRRAAVSQSGSRDARRADPVGDCIAQKIALDEALTQNLRKLEFEAAAIEYAVQTLQSPLEREILRLRYFDGKMWIEIGRLVGYEEGHCRRLRNSACAALSKGEN